MKTAPIAAEEPPGPLVRHASKPHKLNGRHIATDGRKNDATYRSGTARIHVSGRSAEFLHRFYPNATLENRNDWRWQNRNRVRTPVELTRMIELSDEDAEAMQRHTGALPVGITPYYASLLDPQNSDQGLRRAGDDLLLQSFDGDVYRYPDTGERLSNRAGA